MIRAKTTDELDGWIEQTKTSLIAQGPSFPKDAAAIRAIITERY